MLKLKKQLHEPAWTGRLSYQTTELQLHNPSQVEKEIQKGKARSAASADAPLAAALRSSSFLSSGASGLFSPTRKHVVFLPGFSTCRAGASHAVPSSSPA